MSKLDNERFDLSEVLKYQGHIGSVKYCDKARMYHGTMQNVRALVLYEAKDLDGLQLAFEEAVEHYIGICKSECWDPKVGMPEPALKAKHAEARRYAQY